MNEENSDSELARGPVMVEVYAEWCSHCKQLQPTWEALAKELGSDEQPIRVRKVNGPQQKTLSFRLGLPDDSVLCERADRHLLGPSGPIADGDVGEVRCYNAETRRPPRH